MAPESIADTLGVDPEALVMDGYDDCILGVCEQFGRPTVIAYDREKVLGKLMGQGMSEEEAEEWFYYNQVGAWCGEYTPVFVSKRGEGGDAC